MKHRVLLVDDDNESLLRSLGNSFSAETYEVVLAESAQEAIEKSAARDCDLLLMNLDARPGEGWEVIAEMAEENPLLPLILITRQPELRNLAEAVGACVLAGMPVDVPTLLQTIREWLVKPGESRMGHARHRETDFRHVPPASEDFRALLDRRYTTPYRFDPPTARRG